MPMEQQYTLNLFSGSTGQIICPIFGHWDEDVKLSESDRKTNTRGLDVHSQLFTSQ